MEKMIEHFAAEKIYIYIFFTFVREFYVFSLASQPVWYIFKFNLYVFGIYSRIGRVNTSVKHSDPVNVMPDTFVQRT